jgi:hypothetical protein
VDDASDDGDAATKSDSGDSDASEGDDASDTDDEIKPPKRRRIAAQTDSSADATFPDWNHVHESGANGRDTAEEEKAESDDDFEPSKPRDAKDEDVHRLSDDVDVLVSQPPPDGAVVVAPVQVMHKSWASFRAYVKQYENDTHTKLVIKNTDSVAVRNRHIGKMANPQALVPEYVVAWRRLYICTHGWVRPSRGTGKRSLHTLRTTNCPFMFRAEVVRRAGAWVVVVKNGKFYHNHVVSSAVYSLYPDVRQLLPDDPVMSTIRSMVRGEVKPHILYEYIRQNSGKRVRMKDVYNLLSKFRLEATGGLSDDVLATEKMVEFQLKDDGNVVSLQENARGYIGVLTFTTTMMRQLVHRFSEVLLVDCTHKVNR